MSPPVTRKKNLCQFALIFTLAAAGFFSVSAAPPMYLTRTWQVEQGLPQNKVTAVVQTQDGYLWLGTYSGLARFDGVHFTIFDDNTTPELHSSRVTSLFEATDGTLWIGTESGALSKYSARHFTSVPLEAKWSSKKIYAITADNLGDIWLLNDVGELARLRDGRVISPPSGKVAKVLSLARGVDGTIWVGREGAVSVLRDGHLSGELFTNDYVQGFCAAHDGGFWVSCNGALRKWKDSKWVADFGAAPWAWEIVPNFFETSTGNLACGSDGLWLVHPAQTNVTALHLNHTNGLPSDWVISLWEDREGDLWCGTGGGLVAIRPTNLETVSPPDRWQSCPVLSVLAAPDGALWAGTEGAGLYRLRNGEWTNYYSAHGIRNAYVWSLSADSDGKIWAGTWGGGLFVQKEDSFKFAAGLENFLTPMPALLFVRDELLIGTTAGAWRYKNGEVEPFAEPVGASFGDVRAIALEKSGALWFGTAGNGLVRWQNGGIRRFKKADGLSSDFIECLHFADDGALWIGTFGGGLNRFKNGKFSVVSRQHGLPNSVIAHIESDDRGFFWMSSYGGILRASEADLNRCADGELAAAPFLVYGINNGMPTLECSEGFQSAGCKTADGRLWFPTAKGLVVVDPAGVKINSLPPPVRIEKILLDDKPFADGDMAGPLQIPPGRHRIEFEYTGLSFVAPENVKFKCRLAGLETDWVNVGTKRDVTYNYVPPGDYRFQVTACNNDGVWNESGATLSMRVIPFFWQTLWFRTVAGLGIVATGSGAAWFAARRRMRRKLEHLEWQRAVEHERARIAHDIHDDLGAQLTRISMLSETVRNKLDQPEAAAAGLTQIYKTARELTRSMDEIVWAVNPRHDTLEGLSSYLERIAQDLLTTAGIRCRLEMPGEFPSWRLTADVRHNVFLAFKESLHNIVKHSRASEISIEVRTESRSFELMVKDNGLGFAQSNAEINVGSRSKGLGNGLVNMVRRMEEIGGRCRIHSVPGEGTTVVFTVPLKNVSPWNV